MADFGPATAKGSLFRWVLRAYTRGLGLAARRDPIWVRAYAVEELEPTITIKSRRGTVRLRCPGRTALHQSRGFLTGEPETVAWIDRFQPGSVFWDCGANIGGYSPYAALGPVSVVAFELSASNYALLMRNIEENHLDDSITALCIALSDRTHMERFFMQYTDPGAAKNALGRAEWWGGHFAPKVTQSVVACSIDDFISRFDPPFPNYLKIDVDGHEEAILRGASRSLQDPRLSSLLVELPVESTLTTDVAALLKGAGFRLVEKADRPRITNFIFAR